MGIRVQVIFEGQTACIELQDESVEAWQLVRDAAEEVSGLGNYALRYEDEFGDLRLLTEDTLGDLIWVAEGLP
eukprot:CAMPEP_0197909946 /NCGR_PEP_ID=MMETSP1439-20131203/69950_1 /TAXON_ID=66791 /ORGANISM="Gonyaulax spinifera, Strain CCMP409" /LENGTH=72 /DNA_ID=CAMNT_0043531559 /DNA_START=104 /DNA_END=319 /DNA_ORIENTATION=-